EADRDVDVAQAATQVAEELVGCGEQPFGHSRLVREGAHHDEQRDGDEREAVETAGRRRDDGGQLLRPLDGEVDEARQDQGEEDRNAEEQQDEDAGDDEEDAHVSLISSVRASPSSRSPCPWRAAASRTARLRTLCRAMSRNPRTTPRYTVAIGTPNEGELTRALRLSVSTLSTRMTTAVTRAARFATTRRRRRRAALPRLRSSSTAMCWSPCWVSAAARNAAQIRVKRASSSELASG